MRQKIGNSNLGCIPFNQHYNITDHFYLFPEEWVIFLTTQSLISWSVIWQLWEKWLDHEARWTNFYDNLCSASYMLDFSLQDWASLYTGNHWKTLARLGEFFCCCRLIILPQLACSIHETWPKPFSDALYYPHLGWPSTPSVCTHNLLICTQHEFTLRRHL